MASFNPRTYIRYDIKYSSGTSGNSSFNPRTYIRYDLFYQIHNANINSFNPRTYIRYDSDTNYRVKFSFVSIHVPI